RHLQRYVVGPRRHGAVARKLTRDVSKVAGRQAGHWRTALKESDVMADRAPALNMSTPASGQKPEPLNPFLPYRMGDIALANRMVIAPMMHSRALAGNVANPISATYYAQRASAGLIVTEATQVSPQGVGYIRTPGIHSPEQVAGWKMITEAVHRA